MTHLPERSVSTAARQSSGFDYQDSAGLYPCRSKRKGSGQRYRRFDTVAEALRFAIEELPVSLLRGSILEVDEARFDGDQMRILYDADDYPLTRQSKALPLMQRSTRNSR